ncbi:MAG: UDP-N-acetylmuramate dehydrogenase [Endomicrobiia bacterium]|nr:UDP-N-acetylmuramate dehydrogenase [Endomicrobiia bacterium]
MSVTKKELLAVASDVKESEPMACRTTFRIGAEAGFFVTAKNAGELKSLLGLIRSKNEKYFILGAGSNVLFAARRYDGVIVSLDGDFRKISRDGNTVTAGAAVRLAILEAFAVKEGLSGLEPLSGIPGAVGASVAGNAGTRFGSIEDTMESVTILDGALAEKNLPKNSVTFSYRNSSLTGHIVLEASFALKPDRPPEILKRINSFMARRSATQPHLPSAGSVFKNPPSGDPAGKLIEACGLKGYKIGGAAISSEHANFIVNTGAAAAEDVLALMRLASEKVEKNFGVKLEPEIKVVI